MNCYIGILSLVGNSCVIFLFYHQCKQLSPVEIFFVHLAINDVLQTIVSYPFPILASFKHGWIFGEFGKIQILSFPENGSLGFAFLFKIYVPFHKTGFCRLYRLCICLLLSQTGGCIFYHIYCHISIYDHLHTLRR